MGHKRSAVGPKGSSSQTERPLKHFCKTVYSDDLEDKKLRLPNAFAKEFGGELSDAAKVVDPNNHTWLIGLKKSEKHIWFDNGWHEFVEHYSICCGYLLFFGYRGSSTFSVLICDMTDYEIQYPYNGPKRTDQGPPKGEKCSTDIGHRVANDDCAEIVGSMYLCDIPRRISKENTSNIESSKRAEEQNEELNVHQPTVDSSKTRKSERLHRNSSIKRMTEEQVEVGTYGACKSKKGKFDEQGSSWTWAPFVNERKDEEFLLKRETDAEVINTSMFTSGFRLASTKSERAIHNARKFKTKYPSLTVVLRPHHLYNCFVYLPGEFSKRYMSGVPKNIKLQASDGREWVARLCRARQSLTIGSGWRSFFKENNLVEGDVLVLEWIKKDITMRISIFRAVENDMGDSSARIDDGLNI